MLRCTANNNGGVLMRLGKTPSERRALFYSACVGVRLIIVVLLLIAAWHIPKALCWFSIVAGSAAVCFGIFLATNQGCRWWRPFSITVVAAAVVAVAIAYLVNKELSTPFLIGALVLAHLVSGVVQSMHAMPWTDTTE